MLGSLFNKVADLQVAILLKDTPTRCSEHATQQENIFFRVDILVVIRYLNF